MLFQSIGQGWIFLWMALFGAAGGCIYLALDRLRGLLQAGICLSLAADLAFSLSLAALFVLGLATAARGQFRLYCLAGFLCGYILFMSGAAWVIRGLENRISTKLRQIKDILFKNRLIKAIFR